MSKSQSFGKNFETYRFIENTYSCSCGLYGFYFGPKRICDQLMSSFGNVPTLGNLKQRPKNYTLPTNQNVINAMQLFLLPPRI